jgi:hypothetical protein
MIDHAQASRRDLPIDDLEKRAGLLFPANPDLIKKWVLAVNYLRSRNLWILDGGKSWKRS